MMKSLPIAACAIAAFLLPAPAAATTVLTNFTVAGSFFQFGAGGSLPPYGLSSNPTLTGDFTLTDGALTALNYTTGTRSWLLSDVSSFTYNNNMPGNGAVFQFDLLFGPGNYVFSNNTASVYDGVGGVGCNNCVTITSSVVSAGVPEPASWAMMLLGFGTTGYALRRRRARGMAIA